jgi:hypothetical protein
MELVYVRMVAPRKIEEREREIGDVLVSWLVGRYAVMVYKLPWKSLCWHC